MNGRADPGGRNLIGSPHSDPAAAGSSLIFSISLDHQAFIDKSWNKYRARLIMKAWFLWILAIFFALLSAEAVNALGMYGSSSCQARDAVEAYCVSQGGCPRDGYCYFPDGSYCELVSFYRGICPGKAYYEQALWMSEAYSFLNADYYSPAYVPVQYPSAYPYYPYYLSPSYGSGYGSWL